MFFICIQGSPTVDFFTFYLNFIQSGTAKYGQIRDTNMSMKNYCHLRGGKLLQ